MEDGSVVDPSDIKADERGMLRHVDGRAVAMRGDVPRTRSVDPEAHRSTDPATQREMRPRAPRRGYVTRRSNAGEPEGEVHEGEEAKPADTGRGGLSEEPSQERSGEEKAD
jgi:hypothetical protein